MFADLFKGKVAYDHQAERWYIWNKTYWKPDDSGRIERLAALIPKKRFKLAQSIQDPTEKGREVLWALKSEDSNRLVSIVRRSKSLKGIAKTGRQWDADPWLLGCQNGTIDLQTGKLLQADPKWQITRRVNAEFDEQAKCPEWERSLARYWPKDSDMISFIQRAIGYSLTGLISEQCLFCLFGPGKNGKSTFLGVIEELFGDYADVMPFSAIEFQNRTQISNDVAALRGKRLLISSETQEDVKLNEGRIKALTGDRKMRARFMYEENVSFRQTGKYWLAFNHKPRISDETDGMWRRIRLIVMPEQFSDSQRIKGLEERLIENELPGILAWAVRGCVDWIANGLEPTKSISQATESYRKEANELEEFVDEVLDPGLGEDTPKFEIFKYYQAWAKKNGEWPMSRKVFSRRFAAMGYQEKVKRTPEGLVKVWADIVTKDRDDLNIEVRENNTLFPK